MTGEADAAYLRCCFEEAAKNQAGWLQPLNARDREGNYLHPFAALYERVTESEAGLKYQAAVEEQLQCLRNEVSRLEQEIIRRDAAQAGKPAYHRPTMMECV